MGSKSNGKIGTRVVAGWLMAIACAAGWQGCSNTEQPENDAPDTGKAEAGPTWGNTACASCVATACRAPFQTCGAEPSCATHLGCLTYCPPGPKGDVDPACEAGCPPVSGSRAEAALSELRTCRKTGPGAGCVECGGAPPDAAADAPNTGCSAHPLLCQQCGGSSETEQCPRCEDEKCCETHAACQADAVCNAYRTCLVDDCKSGSLIGCIDFCEQRLPGGYAKFARRLACVTMNCLYECQAPDQPAPEVVCLRDHCTREYVDCELVGECSLLSLCIGTCAGSSVCITQCKGSYSDGVERFEPLERCAIAQCSGV